MDLSFWLDTFKQLHPHIIDLGLKRCHSVAERLGLLCPQPPIISIAGTNGKGSSLSYLEAVYQAAGYRVGSYTTPHLLHYHERIRINRKAVDETLLCQAFSHINQERGEITLTEFEFATLAAMQLFIAAPVDVILLEVGLGGRLDAVNVWDADAALITAIGLDHCEYLGHTRELIALEKAGILRPHQPAICTDPSPPHTLLDYARAQHVPLQCLNQDFHYQRNAQTWAWHNAQQQHDDLPRLTPDVGYAYHNAAGAVSIIEALQAPLPVSPQALREGLQQMRLAGRFQYCADTPIPCIVDVAHNPLAAQALRSALRQQPINGKTHALLGMMKDKDISGTIAVLQNEFDTWHLVDLPDVERAAPATTLQACLTSLNIHDTHLYPNIKTAFQQLTQQIPTTDRLVVFGSFYTVAETLNLNNGV